jgi:hypothetical protein
MARWLGGCGATLRPMSVQRGEGLEAAGQLCPRTRERRSVPHEPGFEGQRRNGRRHRVADAAQCQPFSTAAMNELSDVHMPVRTGAYLWSERSPPRPQSACPLDDEKESTSGQCSHPKSNCIPTTKKIAASRTG